MLHFCGHWSSRVFLGFFASFLIYKVNFPLLPVKLFYWATNIMQYFKIGGAVKRYRSVY